MKFEDKGEFMNKIMMDIKSTIKQIDGEVQTIEMMTEGELFEKNGSLFLIYHESEVSGMKGSKTMLKLSGDVITMTRFGGTQSKIIFDVKNPMSSLYKTPYGDFDMKVDTSLLKSDIDIKSATGSIEIDYTIVLEKLSSSENHLVIRIKS